MVNRAPAKAPKAPLILASASPYRAELLSRLQLAFRIVPSALDETPQAAERARALAGRLALAKARLVAERYPGQIVIGADQVAEHNGASLGKPGSVPRAIAQLERLSGQTVVFHSAIAVLREPTIRQVIVPTTVRMRALSKHQIVDYVRRERPLDCAGALKSERLGIALVRSMHSEDPSALIGLPLIALVDLLAEFGVHVLSP